MIFKPAIVRFLFFTLLLVLLSINISYGYVLSGFIGDNNIGVQEWHVVARETSNANLGNEDTTVSNDPNDPKYRIYELALFPGNYDVHCESEIFVNDCIVSLSSPVQNIDFPQFTIMHFTTIPQLDSPVHITGSVINDQGSGIPSVIVSATSSDGVCTSSSESDGDGSFDLTVIPGTYTLLFSAPETTTYVNKGITGVVVTGNTALNDTILNSLIKYLLSGSFTDQFGEHTLGDYTSALINADNTSIISSLWTSTNNDSFIFDLFIGSYTITAVLFNDNFYNNVYSRTSTTYQVFDYLQQPDDQNTLGIALLPYHYYYLEGTVTDNQGIALPDVIIEASGIDGRCSGRCTTDSLGYYALRLIPGQYVVAATAPPDPAIYPPYRINNIDISGDSHRNIRLFSDDTILKGAIAQLGDNLGITLDVFDIINQGNILRYNFEVTETRDLLEIILNWNWEDSPQISLEVIDPMGTRYVPSLSTQPPIVVDDLPTNPAQGIWTCEVTAINVPYNNYPFALVAGVTRNYALNAAVSGGHGTVLPTSGTYSQGTVVSLTATPDSGYRVKAWHGTDNDSSKSTANSVTMSANSTITVEFELIPAPPAPTTYTLNASVSGGNGTVRPASGTYSQGAVVSLSATPGSGYQVKAWRGTNNDSSKSAANTVTMNANRTVTVEFEPIPAPPEPTTNTYTLNISVTNGHGSISAFPSSGPYSQGTMVSLSATPENGYKVKAWTGTDDDSLTADTNTVTMNADHVVTLEFVSSSIPTDPDENKGGGGGGGGCFISTSTADPLSLPVMPLIILLGIVFIFLLFPNRLIRNSLHIGFFTR